MVTGAAVLRLRNGSSMNEKVLNWHLLEDVLGWVAVLVVSVLLLFLDWPVLDPLLAIGFTAFIVVNVCRNLRETLQLFFQAVPTEGLAQQIRTKLLQLDGVTAIHHAHCWSLDGEHHVYTAHLELGAVFSLDQQLELKQRIAASLAPFALTHTTIELELPQEACRDGDRNVARGRGARKGLVGIGVQA